MWKTTLVEPESARVVITATVDQTCRMLDVQHLVIQDVLDKPLRNIGRIQGFTDRDAVVDMIVMTEDALGAALGPSERRFRNLPVEITAVQFGKHSIKIVNLTVRRRDHLASPASTRQIRRTHDRRS